MVQDSPQEMLAAQDVIDNHAAISEGGLSLVSTSPPWSPGCTAIRIKWVIYDSRTESLAGRLFLSVSRNFMLSCDSARMPGFVHGAGHLL